MKSTIKFNPCTLGAGIILLLISCAAIAQQPYFYLDKKKKKQTLVELESEYKKQEENRKKQSHTYSDSINAPVKGQSNSGFNYRKFRLTFIGGSLHKTARVTNPGPLINDKPFVANVDDLLLAVGISYKHSRWICPELFYSTVKYTDGNAYNYYGNIEGASFLFRGKEISLGNRFYLVNGVSSNRIKLSAGLGGKLSFLRNSMGQAVRMGASGSSTTKITDNTTGDMIVFNRNNYNVNTTNFSLMGDILLEVKLSKFIEVGIGIAYFQGLNKIAISKTTYHYEGINYQSDRSLYGTAYQPFIKVNLTLDH